MYKFYSYIICSEFLSYFYPDFYQLSSIFYKIQSIYAKKYTKSCFGGQRLSFILFDGQRLS